MTKFDSLYHSANNLLNYNLMTTGLTTKMSCSGVYVSPAIKTVELNSEGFLCISFGEANMAGRMLEEDDKFIWNF